VTINGPASRENRAPHAAGAAGVRARVVEAEAGGGRAPGAGVAALGVAAHAALVDVSTPAMSRPAREAWFASTSKGSHGISTDCVWATVMGEVAISALVNIDTALVGLMVTISCGTCAGPASHSVGAGGLDVCAVVPGVGGVSGALVNIRTA